MFMFLSYRTVYWKLPGDCWRNDAFRPDTAAVKVSWEETQTTGSIVASWCLVDPSKRPRPHRVWSSCLCRNNVRLPPTFRFRLTRVVTSTRALCLWSWTDVALKTLMKQLVPSGRTVWASFSRFLIRCSYLILEGSIREVTVHPLTEKVAENWSIVALQQTHAGGCIFYATVDLHWARRKICSLCKAFLY